MGWGKVGYWLISKAPSHCKILGIMNVFFFFFMKTVQKTHKCLNISLFVREVKLTSCYNKNVA